MTDFQTFIYVQHYRPKLTSEEPTLNWAVSNTSRKCSLRRLQNTFRVGRLKAKVRKTKMQRKTSTVRTHGLTELGKGKEREQLFDVFKR